MTSVLHAVHPGPPGQPDIAYTPNLITYQQRVNRRLNTESLSREVPSGFPNKLTSSLAWESRNVTDHYNWSYELTDDDLVEVQQALHHFKCKSLPQGCFRMATYW